MVKVAPDAGHDGIGDGGNDIMGTGCDGAADPSWSMTVAAASAAIAAVGDGNGGGCSEGRCRRRSRIPANCWPRLRTAAVNCAGVMTKLLVAAVDPVGKGGDEVTVARVDDGGGGGMEFVLSEGNQQHFPTYKGPHVRVEDTRVQEENTRERSKEDQLTGQHPVLVTSAALQINSSLQMLRLREVDFVGSLEENFRSILRSPSLSSLSQTFTHRRINSLPSFDRSFFQDHTASFTEHSVADSEPPLENLQLEDEDWLVKPPESGAYAADFKDDEWLVTPLKHSGVLNGIGHEDQEWLVKASQLSEPLHIYVSDKNEADFQYVKDILKKSGFSCGDVDWRMLLFDLINEILLDIYDSSLVIGPWHSRFDLRTRPIPMGSHVLEEVWMKVSCFLSLHWREGQTVEDIVGHDLTRKENWMNLVYDAECTALDMEDLMVEDLLDDVVIQIVLESIDE
nr:unnamed protein product [Digitaria exilis]